MRGNLGVRTAQLVLVGAVAGITLMLSSGVASAAVAASGSPTTGLANGSVVSITGTGWAANSSLFIVQCSNKSGAAGCDTSKLKTAATSATGTFTATFPVTEGTVGDGTCAAGSTTCFIAVSNGTAAVQSLIPLSFAAAAAAPATSAAPTTSAAPATSAAPVTTAASTSAAPATSAATSAAPATSAAASSSAATNASPVAVAAGTGGTADRHGPNGELLVLAGVVGALVIGGTAVGIRSKR